MSISREYYDEEGNYWQIETPYYIPPKEAIKHKEYVCGFISAEHFRKEKAAKERFKRMNRIIELTLMSLVIILAFALCMKEFT